MNPDLSDFLTDYHFDLPEELVAQEPPASREEARLLVIRRNPEGGLPRFEDLSFRDLPHLVAQTPVLKEALWVRNRSRVLPARFYARRPSGGRHEIVLVEEVEAGVWKALIRNSARFSYPQTLHPEDANGKPLQESFLAVAPDRIDMRQISKPLAVLLAEIGEMPLPPYIRNRDPRRDRERYQTTWALPEEEKSVAAPTASLHFTPELVNALHDKGVRFADCLLHVGLGTFEPARCERLSEHTLHDERFGVSADALETLEEQAQKRGPFLCVGTTALRTLESLPLAGHATRPEVKFAKNTDGSLSGRTHLFVRPGFEFRYARALLTNFHLPESTLFVLVASFGDSLALAKEAYAHAIARKYRFFSYGDASLWI